MAGELFRGDAYMKRCQTTIVSAGEKGIQLDATVFYPMGGGQPGDTGLLRLANGREVVIADTIRGEHRDVIYHVPAEPMPGPLTGQVVVAEIDWPRRHRLMRIHTLLHLLCAVVQGGVTGGAVRDGSGRIDFDLPDMTLDKIRIAADLNRLVAEDHPVRTRWITDEELDARPELVRTMSVKPPTGQGRVRLLEIEGIDLQPCGGTHVCRTGEIGLVRVTKIEKKGTHNRRVGVAFADP